MAAAVLTGCGSDMMDDDHNGDAPNSPTAGHEEIRVNTNVTRMMTRATTIDSNGDLQGQNLRIDAYYHGTETAYLSNTQLHYDPDHDPSPAWVFWNGSSQLHYYWPITGSQYGSGTPYTSLDFVGYCPYAAPGYISALTYDADDGASFSCDMSSYMTNTAQASMQEYLIATQTAASGALPLVFKHPFALIKFVIAEGSGTNVQINGISISGLYTSATCTYDGTTMSWDSYSGSAAMSQTGLNLKYGTSITETPSFMVIPKDYGSKTLTVNGTWDDWSAVTKDISTNVDFNWEPGYIYTYTLTVTKYALKVDISQFTEQW